MPNHIIFSLAARRKLRQRMARELARDAASLEARMRDVKEKLGAVFPAAQATIVQDLYSGFRDRHRELVLLVEVAESGAEDGAYVVKLGPEDRLAEELEKWQSCVPAGLRHDLVLMTVEPRRERGDDGPLVGLIYSDAEQLIGVDETMPLETALLDAAVLGVPSCASVGDVLFQLYERLGLLFYRTWYVEDPSDEGYCFQLDRLDGKLAKNLELWGTPHGPIFECRSQATTFTELEPLGKSFRDPVSFLQFVEETARLQPQTVSKFIPRILRGHAHGDLHGRNVLVGRVDDRVLWPAVFDYGDMGRDKVVGWDFVKMETELKIRAYPRVFAAASPIPAFIPEVVAFEKDLFEQTEAARDTCHWPLEPESETPRDRLLWLLLKIRQLADAHLGRRRNRSRDWLAEYYFLLTIYGLNSVRFENLSPVELLGTYLSAGAACARYLHDREAIMAGAGPLRHLDGGQP